MAREPITRFQLARFVICPPFFVMLSIMIVEAALAACTTWLVIKAGRDVANGQALIFDLLWILAAQSASYVVGVVSWIYAERAGARGFGLYILRFARDNHDEARLLNDRPTREKVEPFITGEAFRTFFDLMYELEFNLKLLLGLVFNALVLGAEIDASMPIAYVSVFVVLFFMQWQLQKPIRRTYLHNQRMNNRVTAQGYTAWDNIFSGNRYNLRLWLAGFKTRLREALGAQIKAIVAKEGLSAGSGVVGLCIVFATLFLVAARNVDDTGVLIALATTLPRQVEMIYEVHLLAAGWNDLVAVWTRLGGVTEHMTPHPDPDFDQRIKFDQLMLREGDRADVCSSVQDALRLLLSQRTGRINVRGPNGSGKSTLLASLKSEIKNRAYYWPTSDRLAFQFTGGIEPTVATSDDASEEEIEPEVVPEPRKSFSSGERQLKSLQEIVAYTDAPIYLLDEWDANLDAVNRATADALVEQLAGRARVIEISHRDRGG
jgi:hypothetical protein